MTKEEINVRLESVVGWLEDSLDIGDIKMNATIIKVVKKIIKDNK